METLLDDLRWVREASTTLRRMPDPFHQPEPWMILLENEKGWSKALRQLDAKCSRPKKPEGARYMSDDQLTANPQAFVYMLCPGDKRKVLQLRLSPCQSSTSQPWVPQLLTIRALRATRHLLLEQKRWTTSLTEQSQAFLNGNIPWASEEETALADENDRKDAVKTGQPRMGSTERLQRQVMLPLQVWSQAGNHVWGKM